MLGVNVRIFILHGEMSSIFSKVIVLGGSAICCIMGVDKFREMMLEIRRNIRHRLDRVLGHFRDDNTVYDISV